MAAFVTLDDLSSLWRPLKPEELERAEKLLDVVSDSLRMEADKVGKDLDEMVAEKPPFFLTTVKSVVVDVVAR
ncbi:MAG TPA: hypothetical protein DCR07_01540, partial [Lactococcus sp.]|nr:hypothetical protein [Lactococcus sp.]